MNEQSQSDDIFAIASLSDPLRRSLFDLVSQSAVPMGRDEAAEALGVPRGTVAFHLERLARCGLLDTEFQRRTGRSGPGAGRPAKLYRRAANEIVVSVPGRHYALAGELLISAIEQSDRTGEPAQESLTRVSVEHGRTLGMSAGSLDAVLQSTGYEPQDDGDGGLLLHNCPFHQLAKGHAETICAANLALLVGVAEGAGESRRKVQFAPRDGYCCVHIARNTD
ncbi:helix-turn-helix transcriptional regulator [Cryobacterium serini]|uniref:Transcriptional regulator n=1 Tax=Cryobacterium serini TaxID=1259201 RepID=A0A4R9BIN2_9MICO|nr:helix-turn-helix domain-containing protein [Cryobacterium serini]TFD85166.1 transcriptional regulator [Cryobacterium serini]